MACQSRANPTNRCWSWWPTLPVTVKSCSPSAGNWHTQVGLFCTISSTFLWEHSKLFSTAGCLYFLYLFSSVCWRRSSEHKFWSGIVLSTNPFRSVPGVLLGCEKVTINSINIYFYCRMLFYFQDFFLKRKIEFWKRILYILPSQKSE